jgi:CDP-2,3-bis-(O-geranylgeranyl)-sn-glycerol synthase
MTRGAACYDEPMLWHQILFALWLFWPAGIATLLPVFATHTPLLKKWSATMDFGQSWRGKRIFGDHKTWRGFLAGWFGGGLWAWVQTIWYHHSSFVQSVYPSNFNPDIFLVAGVLISLGAVIGDAIGSFFKRQFEIPSGQSWFPYDQLDFVVGGLFLSLLVVRLNWIFYILIPAIWLCVHLIFGLLGYLTKLKPAII